MANILHDYECETCNNVEEKFQPYDQRTAVCSKCGCASNRIVSKVRRSQIDIFQSGFWEELGDDNHGKGPYITSKEQLARECESRGMRSRMLDEGTRHYGRKREI